MNGFQGFQQPFIFPASSQPSGASGFQGFQQPFAFSASGQPSTPSGFQGTQQSSAVPAPGQPCGPSGFQGFQHPPVTPASNPFSVPNGFQGLQQSPFTPASNQFGGFQGAQQSAHPISQQSIPGTGWNNQQNQMPPTPRNTTGWMPGWIQGSHQNAQQSFTHQAMPGTPFGTQHPPPVSGYHSRNPSPQQPWLGICNKSIQNTSQLKVRGAPSSQDIRWDGNSKTFAIYRRRFEAVCKQHGAGYLVTPAFMQAYFANSNYISPIECQNDWGYSGSQVQHNIQWLHGTMSNTITDMNIPQLTGTTDGVVAWYNLCNAYGHQGQSYSNSVYYQELESELRQKFDPKRMNIMEYNKRFLCNAARLVEHNPSTFTRQHILVIYMVHAVWFMGSGLLAPFNELCKDQYKTYSDVINEIVDHTEHSIENAQMPHLNTSYINNMQQQANLVPDPDYVLARDRTPNVTSSDPTLDSVLSDFNKVASTYLGAKQDPRADKAAALSKAYVFFTRKALVNNMTVPPKLWKALKPSIRQRINNLWKEIRDEEAARKTKRSSSSSKDTTKDSDKEFGKQYPELDSSNNQKRTDKARAMNLVSLQADSIQSLYDQLASAAEDSDDNYDP